MEIFEKKRNLLRRWKFLNGGSTILLEELYYRSDGNAQREALGRDLDVLAVAG